MNRVMKCDVMTPVSTEVSIRHPCYKIGLISRRRSDQSSVRCRVGSMPESVPNDSGPFIAPMAGTTRRGCGHRDIVVIFRSRVWDGSRWQGSQYLGKKRELWPGSGPPKLLRRNTMPQLHTGEV